MYSWMLGIAAARKIVEAMKPSRMMRMPHTRHPANVAPLPLETCRMTRELAHRSCRPWRRSLVTIVKKRNSRSANWISPAALCIAGMSPSNVSGNPSATQRLVAWRIDSVPPLAASTTRIFSPIMPGVDRQRLVQNPTKYRNWMPRPMSVTRT